MSVSSVVALRLPGPPGTTSTSQLSTSCSDASATIASVPVSLRTGPRCAAAKTTSAPGISDSTWYGPTASRAVNRSNKGMTMRMEVLFSGRGSWAEMSAAREVPHAHGGASGHDGNREVVPEMVGHPGCKLHEGVPFTTLSCELSTESGNVLLDEP